MTRRTVEYEQPRQVVKETMVGASIYKRTCSICGGHKRQTGGRIIRGKSRYDPTRFICFNCLGED